MASLALSAKTYFMARLPGGVGIGGMPWRRKRLGSKQRGGMSMAKGVGMNAVETGRRHMPIRTSNARLCGLLREKKREGDGKDGRRTTRATRAAERWWARTPAKEAKYLFSISRLTTCASLWANLSIYVTAP